MFDLSGHETLRVGFKSPQTGLCAKVDFLSSEDGIGETLRVFDFTAAGGKCVFYLVNLAFEPFFSANRNHSQPTKYPAKAPITPATQWFG